MLKGTCWITLNPRLIEGPCQLYTDFTLISQLTRLFLAINYIFLGFKCCRPCAVWEYSSSKGKEVAEELQEMDVHGHNYPSHYCCNHCCWCAEAMEQQQRCLEFLEFCVGIFTCINTDTYCIVLYSSCVFLFLFTFFLLELGFTCQPIKLFNIVCKRLHTHCYSSLIEMNCIFPFLYKYIWR